MNESLNESFEKFEETEETLLTNLSLAIAINSGDISCESPWAFL